MINFISQLILKGGQDWTEPWITDGTSAGTYKLDINPGPAPSDPSSYTKLGDRMFFVANDGVHGKEPWITDGTQIGSSMLKDINQNPNQNVSSVSMVSDKILNGFLYFTAGDDSTGIELWATNGTSNGTQLVMDIYLGTKGSKPLEFASYKGNLFFSAETEFKGRELWSCQSLLATHEQNLKNYNFVYPNPVKENIYFTKKLYNIRIYDLTGKLVNFHIDSVQKLLLNHLPSGTYILNGTSLDGKPIKQKFIKQ